MSRQGFFASIQAAVPVALLLAGSAAPAAEPPENEYRVQPVAEPAGWNIYEGDELVAGYIQDSNGKPILYPVISADGRRMTRDYPMKEAGPHERADHPHHRSMWLTHGDVNGIDFWLEGSERGAGTIVQRRGEARTDPETGAAVLTTHNDWVSPDGDQVLSDVRQFTFFTDQGRRVIDCDFRLDASAGEVNFGDTKEGSFGIRVAGTMKVDAEPGGQIIAAGGETNKDAWGIHSPWVDYTGPVDDGTAGITIHYHPSSHSYPCRWHVRTYGLFAANPFGVHHFVGGEKTDGYTLPAGESLHMHLRVVLHDGEFDAEQSEKDFDQYRETQRPKLD